jgi:hypothetical protein
MNRRQLRKLRRDCLQATSTGNVAQWHSWLAFRRHRRSINPIRRACPDQAVCAARRLRRLAAHLGCERSNYRFRRHFGNTATIAA